MEFPFVVDDFILFSVPRFFCNSLAEDEFTIGLAPFEDFSILGCAIFHRPQWDVIFKPCNVL